MTNPTPETIDGLTYLPDPTYPYPFDVAVPPHFWMTEQTGRLALAMESYFQGETMIASNRAVSLSYLRQFVGRALLVPGIKRDPLLQSLERLRSRHDFEQFADELAAVGIEPF